ncbi:hypothetical protein GCM10027589_14360 [Actinocorallia lasiicapitis]
MTEQNSASTEPFRLRARLEAPLKDVHRALTEPEELEAWLAEHAEAGQDRFAFWGRTTPEGGSPHQRLIKLDERSLSFHWLLDGVDTTVTIELTEDGGLTYLDLSQTDFSFAVAESGSPLGMLMTYWYMATARLADHLAGRELTPLPDFTSADLSTSLVIDAPHDAVYASLVESAQFSQWWGMPVEIDARVGGLFDMVGAGSAPIVAFEPGHSMTTDWGGGGMATWELEGSEGKTRLTFVQSGFDSGRPPYAGWMGWLSGISELRRFHEIKPWQALWVEP